MARTNALTTAKRIRRQLNSGHRQEEGVLAADINDTVTSLQFDTDLLNSIQVGTILGLELELVRVRSLDSANNKVNVTRGYADSVAAAHLAGTQIDIAPRFSMLDIFDAMISEIAAWGQQLYYTLSDTFTLDTSAQTLELPLAWANLLGVVACNQSELSSVTDAVTVWPELPMRLIRGTASTFDGATTSGVLLRFTEPIRTGAVFVVVAMPFDSSTLDVADDLVTDMKIPVSMIDVLELGTQIRCVTQADNGRGARQAQGEARRAEETPYGSMVSVEQLQIGRYTRRKAEEVRLLRRLYPVRIA